MLPAKEVQGVVLSSSPCPDQLTLSPLGDPVHLDRLRDPVIYDPATLWQGRKFRSDPSGQSLGQHFEEI